MTESVLKIRSFTRISWHRYGDWKMVYNLLGKDEKYGEISTYFRLKHHCRKEVPHFSVQFIQTKAM